MSRVLISLKKISKNYGERVLFENISMPIVEGRKIALVGPNGSGKTTLLKMIEGVEEVESGEIEIMPIANMVILKQNDPFLGEETVSEFLFRATQQPTWKFGKILKEFGFKHEDQERQVLSFSGGWQMRLRLVSLVLQDPNIILLDEPTNYLDVNTLIYLEEFIKTFKGTIVLVSHDQSFLEKTCNQVLVFSGKRLSEDGSNHIIYGMDEYPGTISEYLGSRLEAEEYAAEKNKQIERKQAQLQTFVDKFRANAKKASAAQSKMKQIEKMDEDKINLSVSRKKVRMNIPPAEPAYGSIMTTDYLQIGYPGKVVASCADLILTFGDKVAVVGENGQGKSTLLKTLIGEIEPIAGTLKWKSGTRILSYGQHVYRQFQNGETIDEFILRTVGAIVLGDKMRILGSFLFTKNDLGKHVNVLSGGEKSRVYLATMFLKKADVYLLDEPTNHLDFETIDILASALKQFNGTVVAISHNRSFLSVFASKVWSVGGGEVKLYGQGYEYYIEQISLEANKAMNELPEKEADYIPKSIKTTGRQRYELEKELKKINTKLSKTDLEESQKIEAESRWLEVTEMLS